MAREGVVLVHGLWLRGFTLKPLANALEKAGYRTRAINYESVSRGVDEHVAAIQRAVQQIDCEIVHLVGHSLGGLMCLKALERYYDFPPGRVVLLGTPLQGSAAARTLAKRPASRWLLGESCEPLAHGVGGSVPTRDVYAIAGDLKFGLGGLLAHFDEPHDGTVAVAETKADWLAGHVILPVTHMSMLVSGKVYEQVLRLLATADK